MSKIVTYAQLHDVVFIPGEGQFQQTFPPQNKTLKNFKMSLNEAETCLQLEWTNSFGKPQKFLVPLPTVKGLSVEAASG